MGKCISVMSMWFKFNWNWLIYICIILFVYLIRLHTGDQPYPCTACGEGFRTKAELNQHNRTTHGGINPNSANTTIVVSGSQQQQLVNYSVPEKKNNSNFLKW